MRRCDQAKIDGGQGDSRGPGPYAKLARPCNRAMGFSVRMRYILQYSGHATLFIRLVAAALIVSSTLLVSAPAVPAFAVGVADDLVEVRDDATDAFVSRLLDEINARRDAVGTPRLAFVAHGANAVLDEFLTYTAPSMTYPNPCMHVTIGDALAWDYVAGHGYGSSPLGEVLACPDSDASDYWTPSRTAESWLASPAHSDILYGDPEANAIACGAYAPRKSGRSVAAAAVLCVTYRE